MGINFKKQSPSGGFTTSGGVKQFKSFYKSTKRECLIILCL